MKPSRAASLLLSLALLAFFAPFAMAGETTAIDIVDMMGRTVHLDAPAERIVALTAADCEILYAISAGDKLVGRGAYCNYPPAAMEVPSVQSGADTNFEEIIALNPQVVIMSTMTQTIEQSELLASAGVTVVVSNAQDIAGTYEAIEMIGAVVGRSDEAANVISDMKKTFEGIAAKALETPAATIYFEVSPLEWGLWTAGAGTFMDELAHIAGLTNAFADVQGWAEISEEQAISRNPDYIVTVGMYFGDGPTPVEEILSRAGWQEMNAIKNGAIFNADSDAISRPGPRLADAAVDLYAFVNGRD